MTTAAMTGVGVIVSRGDGASSEAFVALAEINSVTFSGLAQDTIDVTTLDSSGGYREFIVGFKDSGEISFNMNFTEASLILMKTDFEATSSRNYRITFPAPSGMLFDFAAYVTGLGMSIPLDDKIQVDTTFKVTGTISVTS